MGRKTSRASSFRHIVAGGVVRSVRMRTCLTVLEAPIRHVDPPST